MNEKKYEKTKMQLLSLQCRQLLLWEDLKKLGPVMRGSVSTLKIASGYSKNKERQREKRAYDYFAYSDEKGKKKLVSIGEYKSAAKKMVRNYKKLMAIVVKMTKVGAERLKCAKTLEKAGLEVNRSDLGCYYRPNRLMIPPSEKSLFKNAKISDIGNLIKQLRKFSKSSNSELREWASMYLQEIEKGIKKI